MLLVPFASIRNRNLQLLGCNGLFYGSVCLRSQMQCCVCHSSGYLVCCWACPGPSCVSELYVKNSATPCAATFPAPLPQSPLCPYTAWAPLPPAPVTSVSGDYFSLFYSVANSCAALHRGLFYSLTVLTALLSLPNLTSSPSGWLYLTWGCPGRSHWTVLSVPLYTQTEEEMPPHACVIANPEKNECKLKEMQEKCLSVGICIPQVLVIHSSVHSQTLSLTFCLTDVSQPKRRKTIQLRLCLSDGSSQMMSLLMCVTVGDTCLPPLPPRRGTIPRAATIITAALAPCVKQEPAGTEGTEGRDENISSFSLALPATWPEPTQTNQSLSLTLLDFRSSPALVKV